MGIMTIPAEITFPVCGQIDPRNFAGAIGVFIVALAAEFPSRRLIRQRGARAGQMRLGYGMTFLTRQRFVRRDALLIRNLAVAGAAILGRPGCYGVVRIMTTHARFAGIMQSRNNLRESGRARRVITVTDRAEVSFARRRGRKLVRRLDMLGGSPMTDLACQILVVGICFQLIDVFMAFDTGAITGVFDRMGRDLGGGIRPIVAIFAK